MKKFLVLSLFVFCLFSRVAYAQLSSTPDSHFPVTDGDVYVITPANDGSVYVGGFFTTIGGVARNNLAHVLAKGKKVDQEYLPDSLRGRKYYKKDW
jgi:hypothetical protein